MNFNIIRESKVEKTFRVESVMGRFDLKTHSCQEIFTGDIDIPEQWSIGLIVGKSGSGKTTILNELFPDLIAQRFDYSEKSILDDMPKDVSVDHIIKTFNSVGFSSPPSWLKPYKVLSNGEKMRVDLANAMLKNNSIFVFDEFTSVVDRQVAKIGSFAIQKAIRKTSKQFIACTCHYDVEEWLLPDWIFSTDTMTFQLSQKKNRPDLKFEIFETHRKRHYWKMFSKHHYLDAHHSDSAKTFIGTIDGNICGFCSVIHFPHPKIKNMRKIHRLVVLPDYQGIGVGILLLNHIVKFFIENNYRIGITTSAPSLIYGLKKHKNWLCKSLGRKSKSKSKTISKQFKSTISTGRITATFEYKA